MSPLSPTCARILSFVTLVAVVAGSHTAFAQQTDVTQAPNTLGVGIQKSLAQQIGAGRGDVMTPGSSIYLIERDPFRSIARGRQLFQRKFTEGQGLGPRKNDGVGNIEVDAAIGAGLSDSCAACHSRPQGSAGVGGNVFTRPESRDAPHLFGLGLQEMLADEITHDLRAIRASAIASAQASGQAVTRELGSKGVLYGSITALPNGTVDTSAVQGVDHDLRVRPFFAQGKTISMREFLVGAFKAEMGLEAYDPDLIAASQGQDVVTPSGMVLSGSTDTFEAPPVTSPTVDGDGDGRVNEIPTSLVDSMEFYLLNYFKPGRGRESQATQDGQRLVNAIGCTKCHVETLMIEHDRRVADVQTVYDPLHANGVFNSLFATAVPRFTTTDDGSGLPTLKRPQSSNFVVEDIYADFKRHDLGPKFHERNFDGSVTTMFMTEPLWGVGSTAPYGHDGRSLTLEDVILRHGGEAQLSRDRFAALTEAHRGEVLAFLNSLVLFSPPDTASNLEPANPLDPAYPLHGHGGITLSVLFVTTTDKE